MSKKTPSDILVTPISFTIHRKDKNPIFGEGVIRVSTDDEAEGPFITLSSEDQKISIDLDELEIVTKVARKLIKSYPK
jgi:hypothetical protein